MIMISHHTPPLFVREKNASLWLTELIGVLSDKDRLQVTTVEHSYSEGTSFIRVHNLVLSTINQRHACCVLSLSCHFPGHLSSGNNKQLQSNLSLRPPDKRDHLQFADTQFQSLQFADSNVRSAFLKMRPPEKCELWTLKVGPKRRFNLQKRPNASNCNEKHFFDCLTFLRRHSERAILPYQAPLGMAVAAYTWEPPIADVMHGSRRGMYTTPYENFSTKPGK